MWLDGDAAVLDFGPRLDGRLEGELCVGEDCSGASRINTGVVRSPSGRVFVIQFLKIQYSAAQGLAVTIDVTRRVGSMFSRVGPIPVQYNDAVFLSLGSFLSIVNLYPFFENVQRTRTVRN